MRALLCIAFLLFALVPAHAAVTMVVNQQSGSGVQEQAALLARQLKSELGTTFTVVSLPDSIQVEAWLNRYATAELALVEAGYAAGKPGQFVIIGPVGQGLTLIGRQGISGDLPQSIAGILGRDGATAAGPAQKPVAAESARPKSEGSRLAAPSRLASSPSKSAAEDRYFVGYVYRQKLGVEPELVRLDYWTQQLQSGVLSKQQLFDMACKPGSNGCDFK